MTDPKPGKIGPLDVKNSWELTIFDPTMVIFGAISDTPRVPGFRIPSRGASTAGKAATEGRGAAKPRDSDDTGGRCPKKDAEV